MRTIRRRMAIVGGLALAVLAPLSLILPANAAPVGTYQDSSVQIFDNPIPLQHIDSITSVPVTAVYTPSNPPSAPVTVVLNGSPTLVPAFSTATVTYAANDTAFPHNPLAYSIVNTVNLPSTVGLTISNSGNLGILKITPIPPVGVCPFVAVTNPNPISATVKVTDGTAVGFETLTAVPTVVANPVGCSPGDYIEQISVTASTDTVTLAGTNDNTTGRVDFLPAPAGVTFTGANLPVGTGGNPGVTLTGNVLSATSTIPGVYNDIAVTATDTAGATATDTFDVLIKGGLNTPLLPHLYGGHAVAGSNSSRENVFVILGGQAACLHFTIVGPGAINGHQGWVPGHLGLNEGVYGGLLAGHGYTVFYQPVTQNANGNPTGNSDCSGGPTTPISGTHWGYVYFISGR